MQLQQLELDFFDDQEMHEIWEDIEAEFIWDIEDELVIDEEIIGEEFED